MLTIFSKDYGWQALLLAYVDAETNACPDDGQAEGGVQQEADDVP